MNVASMHLDTFHDDKSIEVIVDDLKALFRDVFSGIEGASVALSDPVRPLN